MNIIQIVSDTLRRDYLGCYGNNWIHTEYLDKFAKESIVFDRAYIASFPTIPHRRDLFTGRYAFTYSRWISDGSGPNLPRNEIILSQLLKQAGYTTMIIADTYHLFRDCHNFDRGFDGWWWIRGQEHDRYMTNPTDDPEVRQRIMDPQYLQNVSLRRFEEDYFVAQTMRSAIKWLELNYNRHKKFFLHVDTFDPHEPWDPPVWYANMYDPGWKGGDVPGIAYVRGAKRPAASDLTEEQLNHLRALYAGEVTLVDRWVGMLLQKIEDLGLFENTAVIFTSDHGTYLGEHNYIGKNPHLYEEVAHIPLIIRLPDTLNVSSGRCDEIVQPPDIMPTILQLAGVDIPSSVQGQSLLPIITGEKKEEREIAVSSASLIEMEIPKRIAYKITVTSKRWALLVPPAGAEAKPELYDLSKDPQETKNLVDEKPEITDQLHSKMIKFLEALRTSEGILRKWRKNGK